MRHLFNGRLLLIQGLVLLALACTATAPSPTTSPAAVAETPVAAAPSPDTAATTPPLEAAVAPTPAAQPVPTAVATARAAPSGQRGGSLTVATFADLEHRDVHQSIQEALISQGPGLAYSRLLRLRAEPESGQAGAALECDLCEGWNVAADLSSYEFRLRRDVNWHNIAPAQGRPLVAADLAHSYQRLLTPGWANASLLSASGIAAAEAPDSHTLLVKLSFPAGDALLALADGHSKIVAPEVLEQYGDLRDSPVIGTGPWVWEETRAGVGTMLRRNPDYFETGMPFLDTLRFRVFKRSDLDQSTEELALAAFAAGLVDVLAVAPREWRTLQKSGLDFGTLVSRQGGPGAVLSINVRSPLVSDLAVRRAIFKAIDPWEYVDLIWAGQGSVSLGIPVLQPDWLLSRAELRRDYFASPSEAREILANSGLSLPVDLQLTVGDFGATYRELGDRVAGELRAVGFNPILRRLNPTQYSRTVLGPNKGYQVALGVLPPAATASGYLFATLHSGGEWNVSSHQDSKLDRMIEEQAVESDPAQRQQQLLEVQRHALGEAHLFSPVAGASRWVFNRKLRDFYPVTAASEYSYWARAWLER